MPLARSLCFTLASIQFTKNHPFIMNKSLSSRTPALPIKRETIPHILINLDMFCLDPCQRLLLTQRLDVKQSCLPLDIGTAGAEKWTSGGTAPLCSSRCNLAPAAETWQRDGSIAGRQMEGAGTVSRTSKVGGRLIECL